MNKNQIAYQLGRFPIRHIDAFHLPIASLFSCKSITNFLDLDFLMGVFWGAGAIYTGIKGIEGFSLRRKVRSGIKEIESDKNSFPLEYVKRIVIEDNEGLECLLNRTREDRKKEWGTVLKSYADGERAVVSEILDVAQSRDLGMIEEKSKYSIRVDNLKITKKGFNGYHHYHPKNPSIGLGATNFSINLMDRNNPLNWINLLTFNLPEGPEIVGFNREYVYISADESKRELVRAGPKQIMEYLAS